MLNRFDTSLHKVDFSGFITVQLSMPHLLGGASQLPTTETE